MKKNIPRRRNRAFDHHHPLRIGIQELLKYLPGILRCRAPKNNLGRQVRGCQFVVKENFLARDGVSERVQHDRKQRVIALSLDRGRAAGR